MNKLTRKLSRLLDGIQSGTKTSDAVDDLLDVIIYQNRTLAQQQHPNPFNRFGLKSFSQSDEDGLTLEILRRIKPDSESYENWVFAEYGVGNGTENNSLILIALGLKGFWVGGEELAFQIPTNDSFIFTKTWITRDNILSLHSESLEKINSVEADVIALDLDGNDYHLVSSMLQNKISPKLFIVEYNAKFPVPIEFFSDYKDDFYYDRKDYYGVSLSSYNKMFEEFGYFLVCCNSHTGANAYFVRDEYKQLFPEVPDSIYEKYSGLNYFLPKKFSHGFSAKTIEHFLKKFVDTSS